MSNCTAKQSGAICGGIDLGGTKIETCLFDRSLLPLEKRRRNTPKDSYPALVEALVAEIDWLRRQSSNPSMAVGIGIPGLVDPKTGISVTSNLPATNHFLCKDLRSRAGGDIFIANDCKCFALSEANGGSGKDHDRVFGLIMGTGLGGGFCVNGKLDLGQNGLVGEVGHYSLPANILGLHDLPVLKCGCGRTGCYETYISGTGMRALGLHLAGVDCSPQEIVRSARKQDKTFQNIFQLWAQLTAELLHTLQLHLDPDCIVLGGGLSRIPDIEQILEEAMARAVLPSVRIPKILQPEFGDSSGVRGAALLTRQNGC